MIKWNFRSWLLGGVSVHDATGCCQDPPPGPGEASCQEMFPVLQWSDGSPLSQDKWRPALPGSSHGSGNTLSGIIVLYPVCLHTAQVNNAHYLMQKNLLRRVQEICDCKWFNRPKYFNGTVDAIVKISRLEGVSSLWSGLSPTLGEALGLKTFHETHDS